MISEREIFLLSYTYLIRMNFAKRKSFNNLNNRLNDCITGAGGTVEVEAFLKKKTG